MKNYESLGDVSLLIVEDDVFNQELAAAVFDDIPNIKIIKASNGEEAIKIIKNQPIDLILMDIKMPKMNGLETLKYIKENDEFKHIPVIMVTSQPQEKKTAYYLGADDFISKPYSPEELKLRSYSYLRLKNYDQILADIQKNGKGQSVSWEVQAEKIKEALALAEHSQKLLEKLGTLAHDNNFYDKSSVKRLSEYAKLLGQLCGLNNKDINNLQQSMYVYDIGLLKDINGEMSKKNSKEYRKHPIYGAEIFSEMDDTPLNKMAKQITLHHHENWDGSGFPDGLKGEEIPYYVRIVTVIDVFDELTSSRFYSKDTVGANEALTIMKRDRGTVFDPQIFDIFATNFEKFRDIKNRYE